MLAVQRIALAYNSIYAVGRAGELVLVDTGPDYRGARETIARALGGRVPREVIATHGHLDHAGLGRWWQSRGVPVALGAADAYLARTPQLADGEEMAGFATFVETSGAPPEVQGELIAGLEARREWALAAARPGKHGPATRDARWPSGLHYEHFEPARLIVQDDDAGPLRVLVSPGHTPGNLVLVLEAEGWLFSGDQLLPDITPTPAIQAKPPSDRAGDWRFHSLPAFVASLERLEGLRLTRCYPGHGEPFDDVSGTIRANLDQIEQRTARIHEALGAAGRAQLYQLCETLYPRALRRRFWQIAATVQGHLDLLEVRAQVRRTAPACYELA